MTITNRRSDRSRVSRLLVPFVVVGVMAAMTGSLHVPLVIATVLMVVVLAIMFRNGYGPRFPR